MHMVWMMMTIMVERVLMIQQRAAFNLQRGKTASLRHLLHKCFYAFIRAAAAKDDEEGISADDFFTGDGSPAAAHRLILGRTQK